VEARPAAPQRRSAPGRCSLARVSAPENGELGTARGSVLRERSDRRTGMGLTRIRRVVRRVGTVVSSVFLKFEDATP
jgi:hypothetical protein